MCRLVDVVVSSQSLFIHHTGSDNSSVCYCVVIFSSAVNLLLLLVG